MHDATLNPCCVHWFTLTTRLTSSHFTKHSWFRELLHTKVPVVKGANQPLVRPAISAASVHGETGIAGFEFEKANDDLLEPGLAATKMYEIIKNSPEKVTLLGVGPLTVAAMDNGQPATEPLRTVGEQSDPGWLQAE